jgi:hypothetical protein
MSFGGINGAGPQGAPIQWPPGCAGATTNGATPYFNASAESVLAAMSRGEVPANLGVSAAGLGAQVPLLQAIAQGLPANGSNGIGATQTSAAVSPSATVAAGVTATNVYSGN